GGQVRLGQHVLHRRGVEAVLDETAPGGVKDLTAPGIQVLLRDSRHAFIIERTFVLTNPPGRGKSIENEHSFWRCGPMRGSHANAGAHGGGATGGDAGTGGAGGGIHPAMLLRAAVIIPALVAAVALSAFSWSAARLAPRG